MLIGCVPDQRGANDALCECQGVDGSHEPVEVINECDGADVIHVSECSRLTCADANRGAVDNVLLKTRKHG